MLWKLEDDELTLPQLVQGLERIRVGAIVSKENMKVKHIVEEMDAVEARLFSAFKMDRFIQKSKIGN